MTQKKDTGKKRKSKTKLTTAIDPVLTARLKEMMDEEGVPYHIGFSLLRMPFKVARMMMMDSFNNIENELQSIRLTNFGTFKFNKRTHRLRNYIIALRKEGKTNGNILRKAGREGEHNSTP